MLPALLRVLKRPTIGIWGAKARKVKLMMRHREKPRSKKRHSRQGARVLLRILSLKYSSLRKRKLKCVVSANSADFPRHYYHIAVLSSVSFLVFSFTVAKAALLRGDVEFLLLTKLLCPDHSFKSG